MPTTTKKKGNRGKRKRQESNRVTINSTETIVKSSYYQNKGVKNLLPLQNVALLHTFPAAADVSAGHTVLRLRAPAAL